MKRLLALTLFLFLFSSSAWGASLQLPSKTVGQGQPFLIRVCLKKPAKTVRVVFLDHEFVLFAEKDNCYKGALACNVRTKPGKYVIKALADGKAVAATTVRVTAQNYGVRRIKVSKKFSRLTPEQFERYKKEIAKINAVYDNSKSKLIWKKSFISPVPPTVVSRFGKRSIVNGVEKRPHSGVDLKGKVGDPVRAPAKGRVALVLDTYFGGLTVMLDHGGKLVSSYLHLSAALVEEGQIVEQGEVIGEVGSTGRVTGPHLHWGVALSKVRVSPLDWVNLSKKLSRP